MINRKDVKINYICCPTIQNISNSYNRKKNHAKQQTVQQVNITCNCQKKMSSNKKDAQTVLYIKLQLIVKNELYRNDTRKF